MEHFAVSVLMFSITLIHINTHNKEEPEKIPATRGARREGPPGAQPAPVFTRAHSHAGHRNCASSPDEEDPEVSGLGTGGDTWEVTRAGCSSQI